ncbi:MAG: hypothetical protein ACTSX1_05150 [Candidatus Heimdallarchaeaceae archaeon]
MKEIPEISLLAIFRVDNQSQRELDSIKSTFSLIGSAFVDTNKEGNVFLQNLKNLNVESSFLQKN